VGTRPTSHAFPAAKKRTWLTRAAFSLLVLLGLSFRLPPLLRATVGDAGETAGTPIDSAGTSASEPDRAQTHSAASANGLCAACSTRLESPGIVLTATILGKTRRAAVINGRLRREGDAVMVADTCYRLTKVGEDRIELLRTGRPSGGDRQLSIRLASSRDGKK
jgi:hypothetical protein